MSTTHTTTPAETTIVLPGEAERPKSAGLRYFNWAIGLERPAKQARGDAARKFVLVTLAWHANADGVCWPSQATLARETRMTVREVQRNLDKLEADGLISRRHRKDPKTGKRTSDAYQLHMPVASTASVH